MAPMTRMKVLVAAVVVLALALGSVALSKQPSSETGRVRTCVWTNPAGHQQHRTDFEDDGKRVPKRFTCGAWSPARS